MENLRLVYKKELTLAKAHVKAQKKPNNGNALTKEKRNKMLEFNIDCVHCGTLLSGNNYNTEHILDVSLGGQNSVDNKMLMCKICNSARAELKVSLLGNQPTEKDWSLVEAYVLWSFITVDHGHAAGVNIPSVHQEFLRLASGGRERERSGTRWFARASNTSLTAPVPGRPGTAPPQATGPRSRPSPRRGLFSFGWRDWFRGSERDRKRAQRVTKARAKINIASSEGETIPAEINLKLFHKKGALAAARMPDNVNPKKESSGSQFYIVQGRVFTEEKLGSLSLRSRKKYSEEQVKTYGVLGGAPHLDGSYTVFGEVVKGLEVVGLIANQKRDENNRPLKNVEMSISRILTD